MPNFDHPRPFEVAPNRRRVLTIDDNRAIHADYRKVLLNRDQNAQLDQAEELLFGDDTAGTAQAPSAQSELVYEIDSAFQGQQGFELVKQSIVDRNPYAVAFIDVRMPPGWDGIETAQRIWEIAPDLPIVLCTAYSDHSWEEISQRLNRTDQLLILKKPFDPVELRQIAASQTARWYLTLVARRKQEELEAMVDERTHEIAMTRDLVFFTLARLAESRDPETGEHLDRIQGYTRLLTEHLAKFTANHPTLDRRMVETIVRSSVLHDIGKVGVPDSILLKPGRLTPDEFEIMKKHAAIGADALEDAAAQSECSEFLKTAAEIARYHHERYDGSGYPVGLEAENIPLAARIVAVADVFDALTSERVYKKAMDPLDARELICSESGSHFDPVMVEAFEACWDDFLRLATEGREVDLAAQSTETAIEEAETVVSTGANQNFATSVGSQAASTASAAAAPSS